MARSILRGRRVQLCICGELSELQESRLFGGSEAFRMAFEGSDRLERAGAGGGWVYCGGGVGAGRAHGALVRARGLE